MDACVSCQSSYIFYSIVNIALGDFWWPLTHLWTHQVSFRPTVSENMMTRMSATSSDWEIRTSLKLSLSCQYCSTTHSKVMAFRPKNTSQNANQHQWQAHNTGQQLQYATMVGWTVTQTCKTLWLEGQISAFPSKASAHTAYIIYTWQRQMKKKCSSTQEVRDIQAKYKT